MTIRLPVTLIEEIDYNLQKETRVIIELDDEQLLKLAKTIEEAEKEAAKAER